MHLHKTDSKVGIIARSVKISLLKIVKQKYNLFSKNTAQYSLDALPSRVFHPISLARTSPFAPPRKNQENKTSKTCKPYRDFRVIPVNESHARTKRHEQEKPPAGPPREPLPLPVASRPVAVTGEQENGASCHSTPFMTNTIPGIIQY
jgi:hypothetical protein